MSWESVFNWITANPALAYWVQAVGSIFAIIGVFIVSRIQTSAQIAIAQGQIQHQIDMKNREVADRAVAILAVVDCASRLCEAIYETSSEDKSVNMLAKAWNAHFREVSQASLHALRGVPVYELGSYQLVVQHGIILAAFVKFVSEVEIVIVNERSVDVPESMGVFGGMKHQNTIMQEGFAAFKQAHRIKYGDLPV
ncbi:hypothetical protein [Pseudomonas psychrophila]|uniref:hypothetical protein n=1 Tax=Pseudomonas psychrophila TaxID=122355 RepID=UPI000A5738C3|nr:hypothetical protein [Pseudomonas psychrophila]